MRVPRLFRSRNLQCSAITLFMVVVIQYLHMVHLLQKNQLSPNKADEDHHHHPPSAESVLVLSSDQDRLHPATSKRLFSISSDATTTTTTITTTTAHSSTPPIPTTNTNTSSTTTTTTTTATIDPPPINQLQLPPQPKAQHVFAVDHDAFVLMRSLENPARGGGTTRRFDNTDGTTTIIQAQPQPQPQPVRYLGAATTSTTATTPQEDTEQEIMDKIRNNAFSKRLRRDPKRRRPPLETVVENVAQNTIIGDPQFLLDFAIIGHAKCATSTMMHWLGSHPEALVFPYEVPHLSRGKLGAFIKKLYNGLDKNVTVVPRSMAQPTGTITTTSTTSTTSSMTTTTTTAGITTNTTILDDKLLNSSASIQQQQQAQQQQAQAQPPIFYQRGYKHPGDIQNLRAIRYLRTYFPRTKLIIGIRHPIPWFESFYNFRIQTTGTMPEPSQLLNKCIAKAQGVCVSRAKYQMSLASLGKTNLTRTISIQQQQQEHFVQQRNPASGIPMTASEMDLKERNWFTPDDYKQWVHDPPRYAPNPVFLYDTQQLVDDDHDNTTAGTTTSTTSTTNTTTNGGMSRARQFRHDLHQFLGFHPTHELPPLLHYSPGKTKRFNATEQARRDALKISICDSEHGILREELLEIAQKVGPWIRDYFLKSPDVVVSSPDYFVSHILESYQQDPCLTATAAP